MKELTLDATVENISTVTAFVDEELEKIDCPVKAQMQIDIAIDEVFSNIGLKDRQQKIDHESKRLPKQYQETELSILANQIGERETTNNPFGLKNDFYTHRIRAHEPEFKVV